MNATTTKNPRRLILADELLTGIVGVFALMLYGILRYPASMRQGGLVSFLATAGALLAYGGGALWTRRQSSGALSIALAQGAKVGTLLGAAAIVSHSLEIFASLDSPVSALLGVSMWGLMFLAFGGTASATYHQVGSLRLAVIASIWSALVSTIVTLLYGYTIGLLFMSHMQYILHGAYIQSGMSDSQAFVVQNSLNSGAAHVLLAPFMAVLFGFAGGLARAILRSIPRGVAIALGIFELLLLGAGLAAIRFASSLNRGDRPLYIMFGLLALGVTMASAHPVLTAIRRQATTCNTPPTSLVLDNSDMLYSTKPIDKEGS